LRHEIKKKTKIEGKLKQLKRFAASRKKALQVKKLRKELKTMEERNVQGVKEKKKIDRDNVNLQVENLTNVDPRMILEQDAEAKATVDTPSKKGSKKPVVSSSRLASYNIKK
jgi:hypothetical protein